jgi:hypothetical protein
MGCQYFSNSVDGLAEISMSCFTCWRECESITTNLLMFCVYRFWERLLTIHSGTGIEGGGQFNPMEQRLADLIRVQGRGIGTRFGIHKTSDAHYFIGGLITEVIVTS